MIRCDAATIDPSAQIAQTAVIAAPFRPLQAGRQLVVECDTVVEAGAWIGQYTMVGQGAMISSGAMLEDFVTVQPRAMIGPRVLVVGRSRIGINATIGADSVIKGYVGDNSWIGAGCRIAGDLIHRQLDPSVSWDDPAGEEPAPVVEDGAFIGWRALVVGGVNIGRRAYVCAGALVTEDVPAGYIAYGRNRHIHPNDWPGQLGKSPFFVNSPSPKQPRRRSMRWHSQTGYDRRAGLADPGPVGQRRSGRLLSLAGPERPRYRRPPAP